MTEKKMSALDRIKNLAKPQPSVDASLPSITDPAIAGAKKDKQVVRLGYDPEFASKAKLAADYFIALKDAQSNFEPLKEDMRLYGSSKRETYNTSFKTNVTTVCIPFQTTNSDGETVTEWVQVICSNKYSLQQDLILNNRDQMGEWFQKLFEVEETEVLKSESKSTIFDLLVEAGLSKDEAETAMSNLFEKREKVSARKDYEQASKEAPEAVKLILDQGVTRAQPGIKFQESKD